jgi:bilin biosynthesis protein
MSDDLNELPPVPDVPDAGDELANASSAIAGLDDDQALRQIGRRTGWFGRIAGGTMIAGALGLGGFYYQRSQVYEEQRAAYERLQGPVADGGAENEAQFLTEVRAMLAGGIADNELRSEMIAELGEHHDAEAVPLLIPFLDTAGLMRADAARALARIGSPGADSAKADLLRVLPSCDERDRTPVVWALAVLNEPAAADDIVSEFALGHLSGQEGFDPRIISTVLGPARLGELTEHENAGVRVLVAQALSEIGTTDVIAPLTALLDDEEDNVRRQAAAGLGRIGDPRAAEPLFAAMAANPGMRVVVNDALRRSTGAAALTVLLASTTDETTQLDLVTMLHNSHDPAAADGLASQLGNASELVRIEAAHGLAALGDARAVPVLLALAQGTSLETARDALDHLKMVTSPEVAPALIPLLEGDQWMGRRAGVIRALGRTGSPDAARALMGLLEGDDMPTVAIALAELNSDDAFRTLVRLIPRPRDEDWAQYDGMCGVTHEPQLNIRTGAIRAMGRYGRPDEDAVEILTTVVEDPQDDVRLRAEAGTALGALADDAVLELLIGKIQETDLDEAARRFYLNALWQHPSQALAGRLLDLIENPATPPDVRRPAAIAVGYTADPANDARLIAMLNGDMARDAAFAIVLGGSDAAAAALGERISTDADLRDSLQQGLVHAETDWFNLIRTDTWDSGEVHRRLRVARILNDLPGDARFGLPWTETMTRLAGGYDGHLGLSTTEVRRRIYADLTGSDPDVRDLAADVLGAMNELGLLMAARDANGPGADEAREKLREINRASEG